MTTLERLRPHDDIILRFTKPMSVEDVRVWADQMSAAFPDRRVVMVDKDTEVRLVSRARHTTNALLAIAIAIQVAAIVSGWLT